MANKKVKPSKIIIKQSLIIDHISEIKAQFDAAFEKGGDILVSALQKEIAIDLAGVQLLWFFTDKARKTGRKLQLDVNFSRESVELISKTGVEELLQTSNE
jgi:hypothetical protein